jgi:hypothetical protein
MKLVTLTVAILALILLGWTLVRASHHRTSGQQPEQPLQLVSAEAAAKRALCLGSVLLRGEFEQVIAVTREQAPQEERPAIEAHRELSNEITAWLREEQLWGSLSARERKLLQKPLGTWSLRDRIDVSWRSEALHVILWALERQESVLPYDHQAGDLEPEMIKILGVLKPTQHFMKQAKLRPQAEIEKARLTAETWHWRSRTTLLQKSPDKYKPPEDLTFQQIISMSVEWAQKEGLFKPIGDDYPAFGKPYSELSDDEWSTMTSIAMERHYGLNWLCGYSADWDNVPTDT